MTDRQMPSVEECVEQSVAYLASPRALESIKRDPYWPKWDSPWWHMTLLWEMGLAGRIPPAAAEAMTEALGRHYIQTFPLTEAELPPGVDGARNVLCHCAVGIIHQVLTACGVPVDARLPWLKRFLLRYQLPDGGLNCEPSAYNGSRKSSMPSTVAAMEAVLHAASTLSPAEEAFVDRCAQYLIAHKLFRATTGQVIDTEWLQMCFPRFYYYDILRGLTVLLAWSKRRRRPLPPHATTEAWGILTGKTLCVERYALTGTSLVWDGSAWTKSRATTFPLLTAVSRVGQACAFLRLG